ncbi:MAG: HAD family hydrolase [Gammaproteobacteria bacterium]
MNGTFSGIVFDMDGVLIDSEPIVKRCGQIAAIRYGAELSDALYNRLIGLPAKEVEQGLQRAFGDEFPMSAFREELERLWHEHVQENGMPVKPGIIEALTELQKHSVPYAIATSTPHERAQLSLYKAGILAHFEIIVGGDQVSNGKPSPEIFLTAAGHISIDPQHCIAIEDSAVGVQAASSAGMYTIMIPDQKQPDPATEQRLSELFPSMPDAFPRILELLGC